MWRWCNFCISVDEVRIMEKYQLISVVVMRLNLPVVVLLCRGCGVVIGIDGTLSGLVQPVHDLLGGLDPSLWMWLQATLNLGWQASIPCVRKNRLL